MLMRILCSVWQGLVGCPGEPKRPPESEEAPPKSAGENAKGANVDDLTAIRGIGIVAENRLAAAGITSYAQLARAKPDDVRNALAGYGGGAKVEEWIKQARELASRK